VNAASDNQSAANANRKYFTFIQVKSIAAYIRVIISKFLTEKSRCGLYTRKYGILFMYISFAFAVPTSLFPSWSQASCHISWMVSPQLVYYFHLLKM
jgi:hypothetical protein